MITIDLIDRNALEVNKESHIGETNRQIKPDPNSRMQMIPAHYANRLRSSYTLWNW